MNFKVGDILYWGTDKARRWKILKLTPNQTAIIQLIYKPDYTHSYTDNMPVGTTMDWDISTAKLFEKTRGKPHPLTNIFKN